MTDIVERLRDCHLVFKHRDIAEAADEIERLRAILLKLVEDIDGGFPRDEGYDMAMAELTPQQPVRKKP
jgi:hypothetical protein